MDIALSKSLDIFDIFVKSPKTNLNTVINNSNQNVLVKLFVANFCNTLSLTDRLQIVSVVIIIDHLKVVVTVVTLQITNTLFLRYQAINKTEKVCFNFLYKNIRASTLSYKIKNNHASVESISFKHSFQLTNLMQRGANPLLECYNGSEKYQNLFVFANKIMENFESQPKQHGVY